MRDTPHLSVVIPAFNEEKRLAKCLNSVLDYLASQDSSSEIIVVDDGSTDKTHLLAKKFNETIADQTEKVSYHIVRNNQNVGKGYSVARGMERARGERVLFTDADLSAPIGQADELTSRLENGYDVAIGSRRLPDSQVEPHPFYRRVMGLFFGFLTSLVVISGFRDTQCGFKMYTREAAKAISSRQVMPGFVFDVEQLFIAKRLGFKIAEVPVFWVDDRETKVRVMSDPLKMAIGLIKIRIIHWRLGKAGSK